MKDFKIDPNATDLFPPHLLPAQIHNGIKEGKLHQGTYHTSQHNFLEGYVNIDAYEDAVIVQGRSGQNRAVDGDIVAIEVFKKENWVTPSDVVLEDEGQTEKEIEQVENVLKEGCKVKKEHAKPTGRVVGIIRRKWRQYCGILQQSDSDSVYQLFVPADKKIPKIRIETRQVEFLRSQKIIVAIDSWPRHSRYPNVSNCSLRIFTHSKTVNL